ncbi:BA75_02336T0 [Komagataella pastoris]|uniref:BA75_02336T0 n=1 Tax=Komagataella pastoris TaxID=4922 RepID=A0A1B2JED0_PICPA|nr:BA75_02336T0 [Komagataella pastoris]
MNEYIEDWSEEQCATLQSSLEVHEPSTLRCHSRKKSETGGRQFHDGVEIKHVGEKGKYSQRKAYASSKQQINNSVNQEPSDGMNKTNTSFKRSHLEQFSDQKTDTDYDDFNLSGLELENETDFAQRIPQKNRESISGNFAPISWNAQPQPKSSINLNLSSNLDYKGNNSQRLQSLHGKRSMPLLRYEGSNIVPSSASHQLRKVSSIIEMPFRTNRSAMSEEQQEDSIEDLNDHEDELEDNNNFRITLGDRQSLKKLINLANYMEVSHTNSSAGSTTKKSRMRLIRHGPGRKERKAHIGPMRFNSMASRWEGNEEDLERFEAALERESLEAMASNHSKSAHRIVIPEIVNGIDIRGIFTLKESWKERCQHEEHRWNRKINQWFNGRDEEDGFGDLIKQRHEIRTMIGRSTI